MVRQKQAFTLVELIVVITILAILGTIAFISLQGYSAQSRDSVRITDMSSIKTGLELFNLDAGKYPIPTNGIDITYSGALVWNQGTFGKTVYMNVSKLDKIPQDPLTDKEYTYSVTSNKNEYQLGGIFEGDVISFNPSWKGQLQVSAGETTASAYVTGNYNGMMAKSNSGTTCNVLSIPTIITNDIEVTDLQQIVTNNSFVYNGYKNLPSSFKTSKFKYNGGFAFTPNNLIAYSDTGSCDELTSKTSYTARVQLLKGLQDAYSGTTVKNEGEIKNIVGLSINTSSPNEEVISYAGNFVNNVLGGNIIVSSSLSSSSSGGVTGWRALDSNCDIPDITIGSQTWAGCNSTLGTGVEWGKRDNGTNGTVGTCYDYDGNNTAMCTIGSSVMASNTKANTWYMGTNANGDQEYSAIWGKFYTWANSSSACPTGRHLPSDAEWETLETTLNGSNCRNITNGWLCAGLGWMRHNTKTDTNNLANRLKLPLAGSRNRYGSSFFDRGSVTYLWSSTAYDVSTAYNRVLYSGDTRVGRDYNDKMNGFNVRCLKD